VSSNHWHLQPFSPSYFEGCTSISTATLRTLGRRGAPARKPARPHAHTHTRTHARTHARTRMKPSIASTRGGYVKTKRAANKIMCGCLCWAVIDRAGGRVCRHRLRSAGCAADARRADVALLIRAAGGRILPCMPSPEALRSLSTAWAIERARRARITAEVAAASAAAAAAPAAAAPAAPAAPAPAVAAAALALAPPLCPPETCVVVVVADASVRPAAAVLAALAADRAVAVGDAAGGGGTDGGGAPACSVAVAVSWLFDSVSVLQLQDPALHRCKQ
jgi:hypothetical protein